MLSPKTLLPLCCSLILLLVCSCDFLTDENFNTSQGLTDTFVTLNVNGSYAGSGDGGLAVITSTGDSITSLNVTRSDESIRIVDSLNNQYVGTIGFPISQIDASQALIPADTILATVDFSASGVDGSANSTVTITGAFSLISNNFASNEGSVDTRILFSGDWLETSTGTNAVIQATRSGGVRNLSDFY